MLITQLYRSNSDPNLDEMGFKILNKWNKLTNEKKQEYMEWLADQLRKKEGAMAPTKIAVELAVKIGVKISDDFPPPQKPSSGRKK